MKIIILEDAITIKCITDCESYKPSKRLPSICVYNLTCRKKTFKEGLCYEFPYKLIKYPFKAS